MSMLVERTPYPHTTETSLFGEFREMVELILQRLNDEMVREERRLARKRAQQRVDGNNSSSSKIVSDTPSTPVQRFPLCTKQPRSSSLGQLVTGIEDRYEKDQRPYNDVLRADALISRAFRASFA